MGQYANTITLPAARIAGRLGTGSSQPSSSVASFSISSPGTATFCAIALQLKQRISSSIESFAVSRKLKFFDKFFKRDAMRHRPLVPCA